KKETVNIADVYEAEGFDFSGTKKFDAGTGYRSKSMLVVPMMNMENEVIGVLQLINALDIDTREPVPFLKRDEDLISSLASQAAVAITNVKLYRDLERLFDSFIQAIASAIDEKSPYTAGHIQRVQSLTMEIAKAVNEKSDGPLKDIKFNEDEMKELSIAAWLHDVGKITTPEHVVDKSTKLEAIFDRVHLIKTRYEVFKRELELKQLKEKIDKLVAICPINESVSEEDEKWQKEYESLLEEANFVLSCNQPGEFMDDAKINRLKEIANKKWNDNGVETPYLTEDELKNLSIRKGSLNENDRKIIENHCIVTFKMLSKLPFPKKLKRVPEIAAKHHEKLDGTGYPFKSKAEDIPYQARIMAIADIFEALTARDRPYKKAMPLSQALKIMGFMKKDNHIDPDIFDLFIEQKIYKDYAQKELNPEQIDCD
ncbi:MAG: HD domain-containing protein, partial [Thermodesulfovibrionales bacterium]|nr:HD domain-containing protein [Thermodesulfovibrionales bacterium]